MSVQLCQFEIPVSKNFDSELSLNPKNKNLFVNLKTRMLVQKALQTKDFSTSLVHRKLEKNFQSLELLRRINPGS